MPQYKLTYFPIRGRAEVSRYLFAIACVQYENVTVIPQDWMPMKTSSPFGQLPMLEVDGKVLCQSHVIERYLANQFGLAGKSDWDKARADMVVACVEDFVTPIASINSQKDPETKKAAMQKYEEETVPSLLDYFDKMLKANGNDGEGYFTGQDLTYADVCFYHGTENAGMLTSKPISMDNWPRLKALKKRVHTHPKIAEWNSKRPDSAM